MKTDQFFIVFCCLLPVLAGAQLKHIQHQTFVLDSMDQVHIELVDPYVVEHWAGNRIMTETQVQLYQASEGVLKFFLDNHRYTIQPDTNRSDALVLTSFDTVRKPLRTKHGDCEERIKVRIFVPETFEKKSEKVWARPPREEMFKQPAPHSVRDTLPKGTGSDSPESEGN